MVIEYYFYERDENAKTQLIGVLSTVSPVPDKIAKILVHTKTLDGQPFDISNMAHWTQLPAIYNGTYLWVVANSVKEHAMKIRLTYKGG